MKNFKFKWLLLSFMLSIASVSHVWAMYYYAGAKNSWNTENTPLTVSADGFYEYCLGTYNGTHNFKILVTKNSYDGALDRDKTSSGFNSTNITNMNSSSNTWCDNCGNTNVQIYEGSDQVYYILVYYPNTTINSDNNPKICAATYLPDNRSCPTYFVDEQDWGNDKTMSVYAWYLQNSRDGSNNGTFPGQAMSSTGKTYGGKNIYQFELSQTYDKVIFTNKNGGNAETANLDLGTTNKGKMFDCTTSDATWKVLQYDIEFEEQSGSDGSYPSLATVGSPMPTITTLPTRTGYDFDGFYGDAACTGTQYYSNVGASMQTCAINGDATFYAKWTAQEYNGTVNANGGDANTTYTATYAASVIDITAPTRTGYYVLDGYYDDESYSHLVADVDGNLQPNVTNFTDAQGNWNQTTARNIYPKWSNEYVVTLNDHDATVHGNTSVTATYGSAMPNISVPSKTGYIFGGYWTAEGGSGTKYYNENGTSATTWAIASNTELHAKWTGISYQVAFDANEGTGTMANQDFTYGADATALTTNTYTRSGYYFLGWNTQPDGSGTKYHNGKSVQNLTTTAGGVVTLYAQWAKTYTLYFIQAKCSWGSFYAKAEISYDDQTYYPKGTGNGTAMTNDARGVYMSNFTHNSSHNFVLYKIEGIPEGSQIKFSNNGSDPKGNMSWSPDKPYYLYGNSTWYALTQYANPADVDTISTATNMSAHVGANDYGIDQHADGQYAIVELPADTWYTLKYHNWLADGWSGCTATGDASNMITSGTTSGHSGEWTLDGDKDVHIQTTVAGEYKFMLNGWTASEPASPKADIYYPVGVSLSSSPIEALAGATTTVRLTATPAKTYLITSPTYYYQMSTDNGSTWTTIAETSSTTYDYTFTAQKCKFRVILQNDAGLKSKSNEQTFTVYSTKSFYVYNPYNTSGNWSYLHLYTWDSNDGNRRYNGDFPTGSAENDCGYIQGVVNAEPHNCINGNNLRYVGDNWFYITIDERANCFMLVGEPTYKDHQTITCNVSNYIQDGKYMIFTQDNQNKVVAYTAKGASDYRLKYTGSGDVERYSPIYNTTLDENTVTTSMWMDASTGTSLVIQKGTGDNTWTDVKTYTNSSNGFAGIVPEDKRDKGYVFQMQLNFDSGTPENSSVTDVNVYSGSFYVRTDALDGGWNVYKKADHAMTYTDVASAYDYYLCKWVGSAGTNVKFTVGNDYNPELVASLEGDDVLGVSEQKLPQAANVRFAWNSSTNVLSRAYISGSSVVSDRFLVIEGDTQMHDANGSPLNVDGLNLNQQIFTDDLNWLYEVTVKAQPGARIKLTAKYNNQFQYFYGTEGDRADETTILLLGGSGESWYKMRVVYDFKTNRLIKAFMPEGAINTELAIDADMMIIREHQGDADQITFGGGSLSLVQTVYGAMKFNKSTINDASKSRYERDLFWISFPFDVKLSEAFGFGEYGKHWIIEYYDGKGRATNGFWADSPSNWKFVMPADRKNFTMKAFEGYILALDLDEMTESSSVWDNGVTSVYVYFPSSGNVGNISSTNRRVFIDQTGYECTIGPRFSGGDDRRVKDSYWHCIGVPSFANYSTAVYDAETGGTEINWTTSMPYLYEWNYVYNTLSVTSQARFPFKATHSYLVQYDGDSIYWSRVNVTPASVAARLAETEDREYKLVLQSDERTEDQTFIRLTDDANVTPEFEFNYDLSKEMNKNRGNIYTLISSTIDSIPTITEAAANVQPKPLQTTHVPVGVKVVANGEYTLAMPEGTNGEDVYLIDNAYGTRTNLGLMPYTVTLTAGTYEGRFVLELCPIQDSPTSLENDGLSRSDELNDANDDVRKVFVGGRLYIIRDGKVYDAAGQRIE